MKQLRWKDFSLVSKIVIEVGMIAVLLFAMNMLFYVRINNSMQKMDNVYASNAELPNFHRYLRKYRIICISILRLRVLRHFLIIIRMRQNTEMNLRSLMKIISMIP